MVKIVVSLFILLFQISSLQAQNKFYHTSLNLDGKDDYLDCTANNRNITNQVTIEAWIRSNSDANQWIAGKYDSLTKQGYRLYMYNGRVEFGGSAANGIPVGSGLSITNIKDNKWHHVAGTYASGTWQIWIDGILENTAIGFPVTLPNNVAFTIGKNSVLNSQYFSGNIGEIRIWNTARRQQELRDFMCQYLKNTFQPLVGYFTLSFGTSSNGHSTNVAKDESTLGLNGSILTFTNTPNFMESPPPIGVESIHFYSNLPVNSELRLLGSKDVNADTLIIKLLTGQPKGLQMYRTDRNGNIPNYAAPLANVEYYFGVYSIGDKTTTFQVTHPSDTFHCRIDYYLFKRNNSFEYFSKTSPGNFILNSDRVNQTKGQYRGEYYFPYRIPPSRNYYNGPITFCEQTPSVSLTSSRGYTFLWNTGDTSRTIQVTKPGKYYVTGTDICSSLSTDTFQVIQTKPLPFPAKPIVDTILCQDQPIILKLPTGFTAKWPDGSTGNQYSIQATGHYTVEITEPICKNTQSHSFYAKTVNCTDDVFIPNIITPNHDGLNDKFTIVGLKLSEWNLHIFNRWGNQVYDNFNYKNDWDGENLSSGVYYYLLRHKRSAKVFKGYLEVVK